MTFKCHEISSVNVGIKSVPLQFDWPSALLPGAVRLVPSQRSGKNDLCWEGTCLTVPGRRALGMWNCKGTLFFPMLSEEKKSMEMDAYLDDFKTSIFLGSQRRFVEPVPSHRGPSILSCKGPGNSWDFLRFSWNFSSVNGGMKSVPWYLDTPSDHLPCRVETGSAEVQTRPPLRRGLSQPSRVDGRSKCPDIKVFLFFLCCEKRKKAWKLMLILVILRTQYS